MLGAALMMLMAMIIALQRRPSDVLAETIRIDAVRYEHHISIHGEQN